MMMIYLAFISLYELGYMVNDLYSVQKEFDGRQRLPESPSFKWIVVWVLFRIIVFLGVTVILHQWDQTSWWLFFIALILILILHNLFQDREFKTLTFSWLAWFRFMAPVIFVVQDHQIMGVGLAVAVGYVAFRHLGYLDSKGLLKMPGRQRPKFRLFFFTIPMVGVIALWPYNEARGYILLAVYWAIVSILGTMLNQIKLPKKREIR